MNPEPLDVGSEPSRAFSALRDSKHIINAVTPDVIASVTATLLRIITLSGLCEWHTQASSETRLNVWDCAYGALLVIADQDRCGLILRSLL